MIIFATILSGKTIALDVDSTDTVAKLKQKIAESTIVDVPHEGMRVILAGQELEDHNTLGHYNIRRETTLYVVSTTPKLHIVVKSTITGRTLSLALQKNDTVDDLKLKIQSEEGMPPQQQLLQFDGSELNGDCTLSQCGLKNGATLSLGLRPR
eukprot:TRINITY_DN112728_c0_g1_i1.p1 TRINITY_DN112728_c0_g1~~TRINITY_DN112728_c0_g1_i1.p1  ORF type:complete len:180 (-),score=8.53 TRINITY_DN112728_c0_g1_i1:58-516(-)